MAEVVKGHSGSLVVDAVTGEAYGYIVALDVFGKAQVVPLYSAFEQIRTMTSAKDVVLAEPVSIEVDPGCTTTVTRDAYRVSNSFRSSEDDKKPSERLAERKEPLRHHRSDSAGFQPRTTPPQSSAYPVEESSQFKRKVSFHELLSSPNEHKRQKVEKTSNEPWQEIDAKPVSALRKDSNRIVERLYKIQRSLQKERCEIDESDVEFLLDLTKSMHDQFSTNSHRDQQRRDTLLKILRYEQTDTSPDLASRIMDTNDTERREIGLAQDTEEHHEHVVKLLSTGEQYSVHEIETTSAEQHACEGVREQIIVDSAEFTDLHMISPLFYGESDNEQANLFSASDEQYRDDTTSTTSFNHSPAFSIPGSVGTASSIEIPTKPEPKTCEICQRTFSQYQNLRGHMLSMHGKDPTERLFRTPLNSAIKRAHSPLTVMRRRYTETKGAPPLSPPNEHVDPTTPPARGWVAF